MSYCRARKIEEKKAVRCAAGLLYGWVGGWVGGTYQGGEANHEEVEAGEGHHVHGELWEVGGWVGGWVGELVG